jgi:hypothetical protein
MRLDFRASRAERAFRAPRDLIFYVTHWPHSCKLRYDMTYYDMTYYDMTYYKARQMVDAGQPITALAQTAF